MKTFRMIMVGHIVLAKLFMSAITEIFVRFFVDSFFFLYNYRHILLNLNVHSITPVDFSILIK